jgi:flagellar biosynthesis protein FlhA
LISLAAALLVTRSNQSVNLPSEFLRQLFSRPQALAVAGGFLGVLIFTDLPRIPLGLIAASCVGMAMTLKRRGDRVQATTAEAAKKTAAKKPEERVEDFLAVDPMELEIGVGLIRLADPARGGDLLERIHRIRQNVASDIGIILPKVRIRDSFQLDQQQYRLKIAGMPVAQGEVQAGMYLAMDSGVTTGRVSGKPTKDPAFGTPALWISPAVRDQAEMFGFTVVEPGAVIATHLTETVRKHADELLTRDAAKHLVNELKQTSPAVVEELIPGLMKLAEVQQVLQMLLREQVSIRQLGAILETLGEYAPRTKDPILLTEFVRARLARALSTHYRDRDNRLYVVTLEPQLEDRIRAGFEHTERGLFIRMSPQAVETTCRLIAAGVQKLNVGNHSPVVLVSPPIRPALKELTTAHLPELVVLSYNEITRDTKIESVALVADVK